MLWYLFENQEVVQQLVHISGFSVLAFILGMSLTPVLTDFLYKNSLGKSIREHSWDNKESPVYTSHHRHKSGTPTMAGTLFWVTTAILTLLFNLTREETFLPLFFLTTGGVLGAVDDIANIKGWGTIKGLGAKLKLFLQLLIASFGAYWFSVKLDWTQLQIPGGELLGIVSEVELGFWYVPLFLLIVLFVMNAVDITDGLDGLLAGSIIPPFATLTGIAFVQEHYSLAIFLATLIGALTAFLWFNIHPARFFMGATGAFALGSTLAVASFLTDTIVILPIIAFLFFVEGFSSLLQTFAKRVCGRRLLRSAPIHHHFQALGWPESKIVMRFWIISSIASLVGLMIGLVGLS
ncbi:MAG: phospho-N-acetylmuramoyl-pentapeptide-transferase [Parcubacteria group bacterium SW_4_49_11]|nr:MAG: phospho-N-acetylmuramoyl-pentapeptide-transferase [Parcubacteria group bacterium SW_4_49_11]